MPRLEKSYFLSFIYKIEKYLFPLQRQDWKIPAKTLSEKPLTLLHLVLLEREREWKFSHFFFISWKAQKSFRYSCWFGRERVSKTMRRGISILFQPRSILIFVVLLIFLIFEFSNPKKVRLLLRFFFFFLINRTPFRFVCIRIWLWDWDWVLASFHKGFHGFLSLGCVCVWDLNAVDGVVFEVGFWWIIG